MTAPHATRPRTAIRFDRSPCARCSGSGRHAHNGEHDRCYACDGKGTTLTPAGAHAKATYEAACARIASVPAGSIAPGTEVYVSRGPGDPHAWRTVSAVEGQGGPTVAVTLSGQTFAYAAGELLRTRMSAGQQNEARAALLDLPGWRLV